MIDEAEAEHIAAKELRFEIGNLPHLSDPEYVEGRGYVFEIRFTKPELPSREEIDDPTIDQEVDFYETQTIGEMVITDEGEIDRTSNEALEAEIRHRPTAEAVGLSVDLPSDDSEIES